MEVKNRVRLFLFFIFILLSGVSFAQFSDTTQLNAYIRDSIRDRRPEKVTAAQIQKALIGISNLSASYNEEVKNHYLSILSRDTAQWVRGKVIFDSLNMSNVAVSDYTDVPGNIYRSWFTTSDNKRDIIFQTNGAGLTLRGANSQAVEKGGLEAEYHTINNANASFKVWSVNSSGNYTRKFEIRDNWTYGGDHLLLGSTISSIHTDIGSEGLLSKGTHGSGTALTPGSSSMMFWYPKKSAFRAGYVSGTHWDDSYIGNYSVAFGQSTKATGLSSVAMGYNSAANDTGSFAAGYYVKSRFKYQTSFGKYNDTVTQNAFSVGWGTADNVRRDLIAIDTLGQISYTGSSGILSIWKSEFGTERMGMRIGGVGNMFVGPNAGPSSSGQFNMGIGYEALKQNSSGNNNTGLGGFSLTANTTGSYNTATGYLSLYKVTTGLFNTGVGFQAGAGFTTTSGNTAVGGYSLRIANTSGNTAMGYGSGYNLASGGTNTLIGYQAGYNLASGGGNVFLGYNSGANETGSNRLYMANSNTATPLIYGEFDNSILSLASTSGKFGIRTKAPEQALHVAGQVKIDTITTGSSSDSLLTILNGVIRKVAAAPMQTGNGLSAETGVAMLGQVTGATGDPAALTANREIPTAGYNLKLLNGSDYSTIAANTLTINQSSGSDNVVNITTNSNSYKRLTLTNPNSGSGAGAGCLFLNDLGSTFQYYIGSSGNAFVPNGALFRTTGAGGFNIVADGGPIAFGKSAYMGANEFARFTNAGKFGIGLSSPTATLHLKAGVSAANGAPFKYTAGTNLSAVEDGAKEFDGTNEFLSAGGVRYTLAKTLTATDALDFPSANAGESADLTITITGAADGDVVHLGVPSAAVNANTCYTAYVSAANTITIRFNNYSSGAVDPASGTFRVSVLKY